MPLGVSSMIRLATVCENSWSWVVKSTVPLKFFSELLKAVMLSKSKWLVGSLSISTLARNIIIRLSIQRTFSPPESTLQFLRASSPLKSILPKNPRTYTSSRSSSVFAHWRNQSTKERS